MPNALNLTGKRFGRLIVIERDYSKKTNNALWKCICDCGNSTIAAASNLGKTKFSCGCFKTESARASLKANRIFKPGQHGLSHTAEWKTWSAMKDRCSNPNSDKSNRWGGRGIKVCKRWQDSFEAFYEDMGPRPTPKHSIDRIDNDGNYEPNNCRWATMKEQGRNTSTNHWVTIDGITLCVVDWCTKLKVYEGKPYEMCTPRNGRPAKFSSIKAAIRYLYEQRFE